MGAEPKALSRRKCQAIQKLPCDGIPRYRVKESVVATLLPYSTAFEEIFAAEGGRRDGVTEKNRARIWTKRGMRRVAALNRTYLPHALKVMDSQRAAAELLRSSPSTTTDAQRGPCPASAGASL